MMRAFVILLALASSALAMPTQADETDPATPAPAPSSTPAPLQLAAPEHRWHVGAAFGYGTRTNPLIQSEDIPVIVDVDISWYGKHWFFDNGDIGFTFSDGPRATTSLVARLNSDRVFFGKTDTRYVNFAYSGHGMTTALVDTTSGTPLPADETVKVTVPDRDYAIELGVESLIDTDWGLVTLDAFHDVSGTHGGYELSARYSRRWTSGRVSVTPTVGVAYKSANLNDYYWGVHPGEASVALPEYHAGAGFGFEGGLVTNYYLSRNLRIALSLNYERLADSVAASPLAEEGYVLAWFSGVAWSF